MSARKMIVPLLHALPMLVMAIGVWRGLPLDRVTIASLFLMSALAAAVDAYRSRVAAETQYLVGVRHSMEECMRVAKKLEPDKAQAVLDAAKRIGRLTEEKP